MSISSASSADVQAVFDAVSKKQPISPEVRKRIKDRADAIRNDILRRHGVLNVAVDLVRESRNDT